MGGIKSVVWVDVAQLLVYLGGAAVAMWILHLGVPGGWGAVFENAADAGKLQVFDFAFDLSQVYTFWAGLVGGAFISMASHGTDQLMVQRFFCARSLGDARRAVTIGGIAVFFQFAFFLLLGIGLWSFYQSHPVPEAVGAIAGNDRIFARFILDEMPTGVVGILLGAIFAAAMSSSLNACATAALVGSGGPM